MTKQMLADPAHVLLALNSAEKEKQPSGVKKLRRALVLYGIDPENLDPQRLQPESSEQILSMTLPSVCAIFTKTW